MAAAGVNIEDRLAELIGKVVGDGGDGGLADTLAGDVVMFSSWFRSSDPEEVQYDSGKKLTELVGGDTNKRLLAKQIKAYVMEYAAPTDVDEIVRLAMERILGWKSWYPEWAGFKNFDAYLAYEAESGAIYDESDYGVTPGSGDDY